MVIDCQVCGAQQPVDDNRVALSGGALTCRSCGATIKIGVKMAPGDDDDDIPTRVGGPPPRPQSQTPIPLGGSIPVPEIDLDTLAVSHAKASAAASSPFDVPTSPSLKNLKTEEEPIPLLDVEDLLDADAETAPGVAASSMAPPLPRRDAAELATPMPLPLPKPLQTAAAPPARAPLPTPMAAPSPPKTPSFLEEVPVAPRVPSPHEATTRFNRTFDQDDLPAAGPVASGASSMPTRPPAYVPPVNPYLVDKTMPMQTGGLSLGGAPAPESAFTDKTMPVQTANLGLGRPSAPPPELDMPPTFEGALDLSTPPPPPEDLPAAYEPPAPSGAAQWNPSGAAAQSGGIDLASDLPEPVPSGRSGAGDSDLPASYTGTPYTTSGYQTADLQGQAPANLPDDFGAELPPLSSFDGLPSDLPSELPTDGDIDLPTPPGGDVGIELDHDLPAPAASYGGGAMESGFVLNDDLPTPSIGGDTIGLDLPAPRGMGPESDESVPQLMDSPPARPVASSTVTGGEDTVVVREKRKKHAADDDEETSAGGRKRTLAIAALAAVVVGGIAVLAVGYPQLLPFHVPWAAERSNTAATTDGGRGGGTAETAAADAGNKTPGGKTAATDAGTTALAVPEAPTIPDLSAANVNQLDYFVLREAAKTLAASDKASAARDVLQWARFRMAYFYGDTQAREALIADAPVLSPQASELTAAAAVGLQLLQNKAPLAKKNAERLVGGPGPKPKGRFKDSVAMFTVLAAANDKPPPRTVQLYERAIALDGKALDARLGRILTMLQVPQPPQRTQAIAAAAALVKTQPSVAAAVKLGRAIANVDGGASAMADITAPLTKLEQAAEIPAAMIPAFQRLLAHRAAVSGDFALAKRAAEQSMGSIPEDIGLAMTVARVTAAAGEDPAGVLLEARGRVRDVEGKASLVDEQVKLALLRKDVATAKKTLALMSDLAPRPTMPFVKLAEARIALAEGKAGAAQSAANAAFKTRPKTFDAKLVALSATKLPPPAELAQLTALAKVASNADVDARLARAMADRTNYGGAAELYARALWREPIASDPLSVTLALADAFDRAGNGDRAESLLAGLRTNVAADERLSAALLAHARRHGTGAVAIDYFQSATAQNPNDVGLKLQLARALVEANRAAEAQSLIEQMARTEEGAKSPDVLRELARAWMSRDSVKARGFVNDAIRLRPDAASYTLLGEIEEGQAKLDDAMEAYRKAIKLDSSMTDTRVHLARAQVQRGQWQDAATQLRDIVQHDPSNVQAMELLADAMRDLGKPREALVWYKKALDVTPESATLMMKFARLQLQDLAAVQPAVKSFRQILQVHPEVAEAHYYLGYALKDLGRTGEARNELEQYLKARPDGEFAAEVKNDLQDLASQ